MNTKHGYYSSVTSNYNLISSHKWVTLSALNTEQPNYPATALHQLGLGGEKEIEFHPKSNQFLPLAKTIYITPPHPAHLSQEPFRCRKDQTTLTPAGATARSSSFPSSCSLETGTTVFCSQDTKKIWGRARLSCRLLLEQCPHAWCLREEGLRPHRPYHKPSSLTLRPGTSQAAFQHSQSTG